MTIGYGGANVKFLCRSLVGIAVFGLAFVGAPTCGFASPLNPHAYAQETTDPIDCSTTTPNYGGYFSSSNSADDLSGGSASAFVTKEMWVTMADSCNKWIEVGSVDGTMNGAYWNGAYWAMQRSSTGFDYYEETIQPEYISGIHNFEVQWTGSAWQVVVDGAAKKTVTTEGSTSAQSLIAGIETNDSATAFTSGTFMSCLEYLAPDNTYSWYYWSSYLNADSNSLGWSSSFSESASSNCYNRATFTR